MCCEKLFWFLQAYIAKFYLKQGISSEYAIVDFICMGLLDLWWARTESYKIRNSCL